ncbi:MAG: calcium-binding protein [Rhodospirillales bacterium]
MDAFRAAATASEEKGAEVRERLEQEEAALDAELGAALSDAEDSLDDLLNEAADAQEDGGSSGEPSEEEQAAVDDALAQDLNELAAVQARDQLASGFSRILTEDELAEIKAAEAEAEAEAEAAAEAAAKAAAEAAASAAAAAAVAAAVAAAAKAKADADALDALNNRTGTDGVDALDGNNNANIIKGLGGNDILNGFGGDDTIEGGEGNDIITGGAGKDNLNGGIGDDTFIYNSGDAVDGEVLDGNSGVDTLRVVGVTDLTGVTINNMEKMELSGANADVTVTEYQLFNLFATSITFQAGVRQTLTIKTSSGFDLTPTTGDLPATFVGYDATYHQINIISDTGARTYIGDAGENTFTASDYGNTLEGRAGDDTLNGGAGADTLRGGDGVDFLYGNDGNDSLYGGAGDDNISGQDGDDDITGGAGSDILRGGAGDDIFRFSAGDVGNTEQITGDEGDGDKFIVEANQNVDFTNAVMLTGIEVLQLEAGAEATLTSTQFASFKNMTWNGSGPQTVNIEMNGARLDLSVLNTGADAATRSIENGSGWRHSHVFKITTKAATETIIGSDRADIITASTGGDTITFNSDSYTDRLKFTSLNTDFNITVTDFDAGLGGDKISIGGTTLDLKDNAGNAAGRSVDFAEISTSDSSALDLRSGTGDASIYEFTDTAMQLASTVTAGNAVTQALALISGGSAGTHSLNVFSGAKNIFILYDGSTNSANAAIYYFENNGNTRVNSGELKLLAVLEGVGHGSLDANNFEFNTDPLIFDLDGDGVTLTSQTVAFDTDGDGALDGTTWFDSGDAMLVIDENGNGKIDGMQEVVSSFLTYGDGKALGKSSLDALAAFDDNGDGQITEADAIYSVLRLWNDANGDGVTDDGELLTLADFGITRIGLNGDDVNEETSGGTVQRTFEAQKADGEIVAGAEVSFESRETPMADDDPTAGTSVV